MGPEDFNNETICTCDIHAPNLRVLRQPKYCRDLARFYGALRLSGPSILYWVEAELFDFHEGRLFDFDGNLAEIKANSRIMDRVWREDERRTVLRFMDRANGTFTKLLQHRMVQPIMLLAAARQIHECRTSGKCAGGTGC